MLGSSERTGQRWERGGSPPSPSQLQKLAGIVHPQDRDLGEAIAAAGGSSLEKLGFVRPPPAPLPSPSPPPAPDPEHLVDTIVCAAAEAMHMMPDEIRP